MISSSGYCLCGCGERTEVWTTGDKRGARVVGKHRAFVRGHAKPLAPDGLAVRYQDTKWCGRCERRLPLNEFRAGKRVASYCMRCAVTYQGEQRQRYRQDPGVRERRIASDRMCRERRRMREQREVWREELQDDQLERARELREIAADRKAKDDEDALERKDPMCLPMGDPQGVELLDRAIKLLGSAVIVEERAGLPRDSVAKYRSERFLTFDIVDKLLVLIGESMYLDQYHFERRSYWMAKHGPSPGSKRHTERRRERRRRQREQR